MRRDYDADAQPNASGAQYNFKIKDADKWTKVVVYYDMGQVVNAISSKNQILLWKCPIRMMTLLS